MAVKKKIIHLQPDDSTESNLGNCWAQSSDIVGMYKVIINIGRLAPVSLYGIQSVNFNT